MGLTQCICENSPFMHKFEFSLFISQSYTQLEHVIYEF